MSFTAGCNHCGNVKCTCVLMPASSMKQVYATSPTPQHHPNGAPLYQTQPNPLGYGPTVVGNGYYSPHGNWTGYPNVGHAQTVPGSGYQYNPVAHAQVVPGYQYNPVAHAQTVPGSGQTRAYVAQPSGHVQPPPMVQHAGHVQSPPPHMAQPTGHVQPPPHMVQHAGHVQSPPSHMAQPTGHVQLPPSHMVQHAGHVQPPSHMAQPSVHAQPLPTHVQPAPYAQPIDIQNPMVPPVMHSPPPNVQPNFPQVRPPALPTRLSRQLNTRNVSPEELCDILLKIARKEISVEQGIEEFNFNYPFLDKSKINNETIYQQTLLYLACRNGRVEVVDLLLNEPGIKVNGAQQSQKLSTPLHGASWGCHISILAKLILAGAVPEPNISNNYPAHEIECNSSLSAEQKQQLIDFWNTYHAEGPQGIQKYSHRTPPKIVPTPSIEINTASNRPELPYNAANNAANNAVNFNKPNIFQNIPSESASKFKYPKPYKYAKCRYLFCIKTKGVEAAKEELLDPTANTYLDKATKFGLTTINFTVSSKTYEVDLSANSCTCTEGKLPKFYDLFKKRRIRQWYVKNKDDVYTEYKMDKNVEIDNLAIIVNASENTYEKAVYEKAAQPLSYSRGRYQYQLDLVNKIQTNTKTKTNRSMCSDEDLDRLHIYDPDLTFPKSSGEPTELLNNVEPKSEEYQRVSNLFHSSMSSENAIQRIRKIYNPIQRSYFLRQLEEVKEKNRYNQSIDYVKLLFHGTGSCNPDVIYKTSEKGWQINFANAGLWGRGCYFAEKASYSCPKYVYTEDGVTQILLAEVIVGDSIYQDENRDIKLPPPKPVGIPGINFDSVHGMRHDSFIYVVYENARAYPTYLIEFKAKS